MSYVNFAMCCIGWCVTTPLLLLLAYVLTMEAVTRLSRKYVTDFPRVWRIGLYACDTTWFPDSVTLKGSNVEWKQIWDCWYWKTK
jgi:hypothetical protein